MESESSIVACDPRLRKPAAVVLPPTDASVLRVKSLPTERVESTCSWLLHCSPRLSLSLRSRAPPVAQRRGSRMGGRARLLCCCVVYEASLAPPLRGHLLSRPFLRGGHRSSPAFADAVEGFTERVGPLSSATGVPHDEHDDGDADDRQRKLHLGLGPHKTVCLGWHFSGRQPRGKHRTLCENKIR